LLITLYVLCTTFIINNIKERRLQESLASFFVLIGISMLVVLLGNNPLFFWFYSLYMVKLILAFAVRRYY